MVTATRDLTPRMRRITVAAPTLRGFRPSPAQDVELLLVDRTGRRVKRRYTIRHARPEVGEFDLDAVLHGGDGPGAAWAATAAAGDPVSFFGPRGRLRLTDADWHLFVGDESALPAFAELAAALPAGQPATVLVEVSDRADEIALPRPTDGGVRVRWLHRQGAAPGQPDLLAAALAAVQPPSGAGHGYLLGESRAMVALRPHLRRLGVEDRAIYLKGYWNLGRLIRPGGSR
jgi:NADPH-dependent ferric siderophore reductase